ncbi:MAG: hypothetical protein OEW71_02010 [Candidatus Bathyarchaeota archaeon]|nr:hypothetical protein [Candidatus Bathyarchaeota archaeon]
MSSKLNLSREYTVKTLTNVPAVCKPIVEARGGSIIAESENGRHMLLRLQH